MTQGFYSIANIATKINEQFDMRALTFFLIFSCTCVF